MILKGLNKILGRRIYLKLIIFSLALQIVSLFRNYPLNHPCGRVLDITKSMEVLINCDSAVYMKDAQSPSRLFNGQSVYQDRPLPTLLIAAAARFWHFLKLPDYNRDIVGNSGIVISYSLITYVFFLILSALVLCISCWLGIKAFLIISNKFAIKNEVFILIALLFTSLLSMNELTKTFFWTPGSQMFNLLIPVYLFYLLQFANTSVTTKFFAINLIIFTLLMFSYAFFILITIPLILVKWKSFRLRSAAVTTSILSYAAYPQILQLCGGTYNNFAVGYRRMYLWILDSYFDRQLFQNLGKNFLLFASTFPTLPILLALLIFLIVTFKSGLIWEFLLLVKLEIIVLFLYLLTFSLYGYYSRRLTYSLMIFLFLIILKVYVFYSSKVVNIKNMIAIIFIFPFVLYSWVFTNGPLI